MGDKERPPTNGDPAAEAKAHHPEGAPELPEMDFSTFVVSLSTSAMIHLGEIAADEGGGEKDLPLAKQTIDILAMLEDKTRGNLTAAETRLISELLYDLRLRFVNASK